MFFRRRKKLPQNVGVECAEALAVTVSQILESTSSVADSQDPFNSTEGVDEDDLFRELVILAYVGGRLAIQSAIHNDHIMKEVCISYDRATSGLIPSEWDSLVQERGSQYFQMLRAYDNEIRVHEWGGFQKELARRFGQFCLGGEGENDAFIISGIFSAMTIGSLATEYWIHGFMETFALVSDARLE